MGRKRKIESSTCSTPDKFRKLSDLWNGESKICDEAKIDSVSDLIELSNDRDKIPDSDAEVNELTLISRTSGQKPVKKRSFRDQWQINCPWLKLMFCTACQRAQFNNIFATGCNVFKLKSITKHEKATGQSSHTRALDIVKETKHFEKARKKQIRQAESAVVAAMKNIYFVAKQSMSNSIFADLNQLCIDQGSKDLPQLKVDEHTTYTHSDSIHSFQEAISDVIQTDILDSVRTLPYYSIMVDESTDISVDQNLRVYLRYLDLHLGRYEPKSCLLSVRKLKDGATANKICDEITNSLLNKKLSISKLAGISTDGASVMIGKHSGVVTRLREHVPDLLTTHCISHRLALASGQAADSMPYLLKYQDLVNSIYKCFDNSSKNMARLDKIREVLDSSNNCTRFKQVFNTRWLSFEGSVSAIGSNYEELVHVLAQDTSAKSVGLLKSITTYKFLHVTYFMSDVLKSLSILCEAFQGNSVNFLMLVLF